MTNVVQFPGHTTQPDLAEKILGAAIDARLDKCIVIGRERDGGFWFSGNFSDSYEILYLLELAKKELLSMLSDFEDGK